MDMTTRTRTEAVVRSDGEITRDVKRAMKADLEVPDDRIGIKVAAGFVTIEGTVARDAQKDAAEHCAIKVKGVRGIANKIAVDPGAEPVES